MSFVSSGKVWTGRESRPSSHLIDKSGPGDEYTPVYVVTGFLDAGKTSLLNALFRRCQGDGASICCIQFERGEEELVQDKEERIALDTLRFSIRELQSSTGLEAVSRQIYDYLLGHEPDEVWVEWNGMLPFHILQALFPYAGKENTETPGDFCQIKKVLHVADAAELEQLMGRTGGAVLDQLVNSDVIVLRHFDSAAHFKRLKRMLRELNAGVKVLPLKPVGEVARVAYRPSRNPKLLFLLGVLYFIVAYFLLRLGMGFHKTSPDAVINVFLGILLQAVPFLLIGVLLSSALQVFVPQQFIEKHFPRNLAAGILFAALAGFCLPVCDCASVPIFRSLVRKGVPMAAAVTFMMATPVINPVVILSTWYAFNGNWRIVVCRVGLGLLCAVLIGLTFVRTGRSEVDITGEFNWTACACGCCGGTAASGRGGKLLLYLSHTQAEFFSVGKYLVLGALVSALFQTLGKGIPWAVGGSGLLLPMLLMMGMAFFLSLCSSSDAVVARSFASQFPTGALLGFLVFGPMMDVKNIILLSGSFSKRFILRLCLTAFCTCAVVVFLAFHFGLERILL